LLGFQDVFQRRSYGLGCIVGSVRPTQVLAKQSSSGAATAVPAGSSSSKQAASSSNNSSSQRQQSVDQPDSSYSAPGCWTHHRLGSWQLDCSMGDAEQHQQQLSGRPNHRISRAGSICSSFHMQLPLQLAVAVIPRVYSTGSSSRAAPAAAAPTQQ
jgi:hypothetical protein